MSTFFKGLIDYEGETVVIVETNKTTQKLYHVPYHSPSGFSWGYSGSGPADLALAILRYYFKEWYVTGKYIQNLSLEKEIPRCYKLHQRFKDDFVSKWPWPIAITQINKFVWALDSNEIDKWVAQILETEVIE